MEFSDITIHFNILDAIKHPSEDLSVFHVEIIDHVVDEYMTDLHSIESNKTNHVPGSTHTSDFLYEVQAEKPSLSTTIQPATPELKLMPSNLKYSYLDDSKSFPVIISASLVDEQEEELLSVLKKH